LLNRKDYIQIKTSGTTGKPKEIQLQKKLMETSAIRTIKYFDLGKDNVLLHCLPAEFVAGKMMIVRAMICKANLFIAEPTSNPFTELNGPIDFCAITPYQLAHSFSALTANNLPVKKIIVGSASISDSLQKMIKKLHIPVYETYGMTETASHVALKRLNGDNPQHAFRVMDGIQISTDSRGCLVINAKELPNGEMVTNDLVEVISKHQFNWLGRIDNVINTGGIKTIPEIIERKLEPFIKSKFFIASLPDEKLSEKLVLLIEGEKAEDTIMETKRNIISRLTKFERPKEIYYLPAFKYSDNSKILRKETLNLLE
jgi:O-succinylbenzoic acid--CoA ligase